MGKYSKVLEKAKDVSSQMVDLTPEVSAEQPKEFVMEAAPAPAPDLDPRIYTCGTAKI